MANIDIMYLNFDKTMKQVVDHWKMTGEVNRHFHFAHNQIWIAFRFTFKYLLIEDIKIYANDTYIPREKILEESVERLRDIKFQFHAYFNAIWC